MPLYEPFNWLDHIRDADTGETIQQGTPVSATRMNYIEQGIADSSEGIASLESNKANKTAPTVLTLPANYPNTTIKYAKTQENLVVVDIQVYPATSIPSHSTIGTLPVGFRPVSAAHAASAHATKVGDVLVDGSGNILARHGVSSGVTDMFASIVFIAY